jgi:hypothetical protein
MNTLSERLKYAKRELTALKTSHPRGLGNLRVYRRIETIVSPGGGISAYEAKISGNFSSLFAPCPYTQVVLGDYSEDVALLNMQDFEYTNGGMGFATVATGLFTQPSVPINIVILSLAPVDGIEVEWSEI